MVRNSPTNDHRGPVHLTGFFYAILTGEKLQKRSVGDAVVQAKEAKIDHHDNPMMYLTEDENTGNERKDMLPNDAQNTSKTWTRGFVLKLDPRMSFCIA